MPPMATMAEDLFHNLFQEVEPAAGPHLPGGREVDRAETI